MRDSLALAAIRFAPGLALVLAAIAPVSLPRSFAGLSLPGTNRAFAVVACVLRLSRNPFGLVIFFDCFPKPTAWSCWRFHVLAGDHPVEEFYLVSDELMVNVWVFD